jgi:hypothetical protein
MGFTDHCELLTVHWFKHREHRIFGGRIGRGQRRRLRFIYFLADTLLDLLDSVIVQQPFFAQVRLETLDRIAPFPVFYLVTAAVRAIIVVG